MLKTFNCKNSYTFLKNIPEDIFVLVIGKKSDPKDVARYINKIFLVNEKSKVLIVSKIKFLKNKGEEEKYQNINVIENLTKSFGKKGRHINTVRIATLLESKKNIINKVVKKAQNKEQIEITNPKSAYYFISKRDVHLAILNLSDTLVSGEIFDITLNKLTIEDILERIESFYTLNVDVDDKSIVNNEKLVDPVKNQYFNFKPENTVFDYVSKTKNPPTKKFKKNLKRQSSKEKKRNVLVKNKHIISALVTGFALLIGLFLLDFGLDNYFLYKNVKASDLEQSIFYSDKLRNRNLPTKYGKNYKNVYNAIYYTLSTYQTFENKQSLQQRSIQTLGKKAGEYAKAIDKDLLMTNTEKGLYDKYYPIANSVSNNIKYVELLKIAEFLKQPNNVLVLIQNSNELRPTGGFIGSYALVKTENYEIKDYKFDDIYNVDGTLEENYAEILVETPAIYKDFIKRTYLPARDLNLILDADKRNETIIKYFETATNEDIDAIVYLNLDSTKRLLSITGPIYLGTYNVEVTSENFDTLAQTQSEQNYYQGSSQKKNFLQVLGARAISEIEEKNPSLNTAFAKELLDAVNNKEALLYIKEPVPNSTIEKLNLSEKIHNPNQKDDYFYIIENNLAENKVNKVTNKRVEYNLTYDVRRGLKLYDIQINIRNEADTYSWPYGDYSGIIHIAVPKDHYFAKGILKSYNQSNTIKQVDITRGILTSVEQNVSVLNVPFNVRPKEEIAIVLSLEDEDTNFMKNDYNLFVQKQPGSKPYKLTFNYNVPEIKKESKDLTIDKDMFISFGKPD